MDQVRFLSFENKLNAIESGFKSSLDESAKNLEIKLIAINNESRTNLNRVEHKELIDKIEISNHKQNNRISCIRNAVKELKENMEHVLKSKFSKEIKVLKDEIINLSHHHNLSIETIHSEIKDLKQNSDRAQEESSGELIVQDLQFEIQKNQPNEKFYESQNQNSPKSSFIKPTKLCDSKMPNEDKRFHKRSLSVKETVPRLDILKTSNLHEDSIYLSKTNATTERFHSRSESVSLPGEVESIIMNTIIGKVNNNRIADDIRHKRMISARSISPLISLISTQSSFIDRNPSEELQDALRRRGLAMYTERPYLTERLRY